MTIKAESTLPGLRFYPLQCDLNGFYAVLKKSVTMGLGEGVVGYFEKMAEGTGAPIVAAPRMLIPKNVQPHCHFAGRYPNRTKIK